MVTPRKPIESEPVRCCECDIELHWSNDYTRACKRLCVSCFRNNRPPPYPEFMNDLRSFRSGCGMTDVPPERRLAFGAELVRRGLISG